MIALLLANWRLVAVGVAVAGLAGALGVSRMQLAGCRADAAEARAAMAILTAKVEDQNAKIAGWEKSAREAREAGRHALAAARRKGLAQQSEIDALKARIKAGAGGTKTCRDAITELKQALTQ